jgi:hypothetical protein
MKHISDEALIRKSGQLGYEIIIKQTFMDNFGKEFSNTSIWMDYTLKSRAEEGLIKDRQSMINCGYKVA